MAYTKVFAIRARLDDRVKYAVNGEKTELDERIVYTVGRPWPHFFTGDQCSEIDLHREAGNCHLLL